MLRLEIVFDNWGKIRFCHIVCNYIGFSDCLLHPSVSYQLDIFVNVVVQFFSLEDRLCLPKSRQRKLVETNTLFSLMRHGDMRARLGTVSNQVQNRLLSLSWYHDFNSFRTFEYPPLISDKIGFSAFKSQRICVPMDRSTGWPKYLSICQTFH